MTFRMSPLVRGPGRVPVGEWHPHRRHVRLGPTAAPPAATTPATAAATATSEAAVCSNRFEAGALTFALRTTDTRLHGTSITHRFMYVALTQITYALIRLCNETVKLI